MSTRSDQIANVGAPGSVVGLGHYVASPKVAGLRPDEENQFFSIYVTLPAALGPRVHSASNRNGYQSKAQPARRADNLIAIYEPIV
jgi:hypothetical protein